MSTGPLRGIRHATALALTAGVVLVSAACGDTPLRASDPEETTTATSSSESTTSSTPSPTETSATQTAEGDGPQPGDEGRELTLADFFEPSTWWEEERYDIADQKDVQGIAAEVGTCYGVAQELELRLANNFDTLEFSVAQANDSRESDQSLSVEIIANNSQVEIRSVPFNEVQTFTIPVRGVNALKINFGLDDRVENCGGSVIAVVTDVTVE
jgi:hypothetical protein